MTVHIRNSGLERPTKSTSFYLLWLFAILLLLRAITWFIPFLNVDECGYVVQTREIFPTTNALFSTRPLLFAWFRFSQMLFGSSMIGLHSLTTLYLMGVVGLLFFIGKQIRHKQVGFIAALVFMLVLNGYQAELLATKAEMLMLLPALGMLLVSIRILQFCSEHRLYRWLDLSNTEKRNVIGSWAILAGLLGVMLLIKQSGLLFILPVTYLAIQQRRFGCVIAAVGIGAWGILYLFIAGWLGEMGWGRFFIQYGIMQALSDYVAPRFVSGGYPWGFRLLQQTGAVILFQGGVIIGRILFVYHVMDSVHTNNLAERSLLVYSIVAGIMWLQVGSNLFIYYLIPFYALASLGFALTWSEKRSTIRSLRKPVRYLLLGWMVLVCVFWQVNHYGEALTGDRPFSWIEKSAASNTPDEESVWVIEWLQEHTHPLDRVFNWGQHPEVAYFADRPMSTTRVFISTITEHSIDAIQWLHQDWSQTPPDYLVDMHSGESPPRYPRSIRFYSGIIDYLTCVPVASLKHNDIPLITIYKVLAYNPIRHLPKNNLHSHLRTK